MAEHVSIEKLRAYFQEQMGEKKYTLHQMYSMYMGLMNDDNLITDYVVIKEDTLRKYIFMWSSDPDGFLKRELKGKSYLYSKKDKTPKYLQGLSFSDGCKFSKYYKKINKVLCGVLRKERR